MNMIENSMDNYQSLSASNVGLKVLLHLSKHFEQGVVNTFLSVRSGNIDDNKSDEYCHLSQPVYLGVMLK